MALLLPLGLLLVLHAPHGVVGDLLALLQGLVPADGELRCCCCILPSAAALMAEQRVVVVPEVAHTNRYT